MDSISRQRKGQAVQGIASTLSENKGSLVDMGSGLGAL